MKKITDFLGDFFHGLIVMPGFLVGLLYHSTLDGFKTARYALDKRTDRRIAEMEKK
jgi:hypothetical protein